MDCIVHGGCKELDILSDFHLNTLMFSFNDNTTEAHFSEHFLYFSELKSVYLQIFILECSMVLPSKVQQKGLVVATRFGKQTHSEGQRRQWSAVYYTGGPKAESPLSQGPLPVFVKTLYSLSVHAQTHLPKFPETSLNKGKRQIQSKLTRDSYALSLSTGVGCHCLLQIVNSGQLSIGLWSYPNKHNRMYDSIQLHR